MLLHNIKVNKCYNVIPYNSALGDKKERKVLLVEKQGGCNTLCNEFHQEYIELAYKEMCEVDTLDNILLDKVKKIDGIKIDAEGYDFSVLRGAEKIIKKYKPLLLLEISESSLRKNNSTPEDIFNFVKDLGYEIYYFGNGAKLLTTPPPYTLSSLFYNIACIHKESTLKKRWC